MDHYLKLAEETGFSVTAEKVEDNWFYIELKKQKGLLIITEVLNERT